jgi:hypothetical protein
MGGGSTSQQLHPSKPTTPALHQSAL